LNVLDVELRTDTSEHLPEVSDALVGAGDVDSSHSVLDLDGHLDRGMPACRAAAINSGACASDWTVATPSLNAITETSSIVS